MKYLSNPILWLVLAGVLIVLVPASIFLSSGGGDSGEEAGQDCQADSSLQDPTNSSPSRPGWPVAGSGNTAAAKASDRKKYTKPSERLAGEAAEKTEKKAGGPVLTGNAFALNDAKGTIDRQSQLRKDSAKAASSDLQKWRNSHLPIDRSKSAGGQGTETAQEGDPKWTIPDWKGGDEQQQQPEPGEKAAESGSAAEEALMVSFSAILVNKSNTPVAGVNIFYSTEASLAAPPSGNDNISAVSFDETMMRGAKIVAGSDEQGRTAFQLPATAEPAMLVALSKGGMELIFYAPVLPESAWLDKTVILQRAPLAQGASVSGVVLDRWGKPFKGAIVANSALADLAHHASMLKDSAYEFTESGKDGRYTLSVQSSAKNSRLGCLAGASAQPLTLDLPPLPEGEKLTGYDFRFPDAGPAPATWKGIFVGLKDQPLSEIIVVRERYDSVDAALISQKAIFSDYSGRFTLEGLEPGVSMPLYAAHRQIGVKLLEERTLKGGEIYEKTYRLEMGEDKPAEIGCRLQTSEGIDIREGWLSSAPVKSEEEMQALVASGGFASAVENGRETWVKNIPPGTRMELYYCNALTPPIDIGGFELRSGEQKNLGLIRLSEAVILPAEISGMVVDQDQMPVAKLAIKAVYGSGELAAESVSADNGGFVLGPVAQRRILRISATDDKGNKQVLKDDLVLEGSLVGEICRWVSDRSFTIVVKEGDNFVKGASVSLSCQDEKQQNAVSDAEGNAVFAGLKRGTSFKLKIFHAFYDLLEIEEFNPDFTNGRNTFELTLRKGVKVSIKGPDWEKGVHVRAWIGIARDGWLQPDCLPGNEYGETLTSGDLVFLTPPEETFWIFVGGLGETWADYIFGPFNPHDEEVIELEVAELPPFKITAGTGTAKPNHDWWSLGIEFVDKEKQVKCPMIAAQFYKTYETKCVLGKGNYNLIAEGLGVKPVSVAFEVGDEPKDLAFAFEEFVQEYPAGGYVKSFLVSDRFPLTISEENLHLAWIYYGFNKDWLAHLGGEAYYEAVHLGESMNLEGTGLITWRGRKFDGGTLDFKNLWPGKDGDYSVAYAQCMVFCEDPRQVMLGVASDDGIKAWVNGRMVLFHHIPRPLSPQDQHLIPVQLMKGRNRLTFKVDNSWGDWKLRIRLLDKDSKQPITDLKLYPDGGYTSVETPVAPEPPQPPAEPAAPAAQ